MTEKLDLLMREQCITKHELSRRSGIPYTTIINFYKSGTDNTKLSTLLRLAKYFHVTLDYIADDDVEDRVP